MIVVDNRALAYVAAFYGNQLKRGNKWSQLRRVIGINILGGGKDQRQHWGDTPEQFVRHYKMQEQLHDGKRYINGIELIQYSLMNAPKSIPKNKEKDWITFFKRGHFMTEDEVERTIQTDAVKKAFQRARVQYLPEAVKQAYYNEEKLYENYSEFTETVGSKREAKGRKEGEEKGRKEERLFIAKQMLAKGVDREQVKYLLEMKEDELKFE